MFEEFDRANRHRLHRAALRRHAPDPDAAVQEAMLVASAKFDVLPADELYPYVVGVLRRVVADQVAVRMREVPHADPAALLRVVADPEARAVERVHLDGVRRRLPATWARSLDRRAAGFTTAEVADDLGTTPENARQIISRATARARRMYAGGVAVFTFRRFRHRARGWLTEGQARTWLAEHTTPLTAQYVMAGVSVLSITAFVGGAPIRRGEPAVPVSVLVPATQDAAGDVDDLRVKIASGQPPVAATLAVGSLASGAVKRATAKPSPKEETCAEPAGCLGTGPTYQDTGDTFYLKPLGPGGPHYNEKLVKGCEYVDPANPVLGCRREGTPKGGWAVEPPPPPSSFDPSPNDPEAP